MCNGEAQQTTASEVEIEVYYPQEVVPGMPWRARRSLNPPAWRDSEEKERGWKENFILGQVPTTPLRHEFPHTLLDINNPWRPLCVCVCVCVCVRVHACACTQLCPTFCDPMDCSPPDSSVHEIFWETILEWVAIGLSRGSS